MLEKYKSSLLKGSICQNCRDEHKKVIAIAVNGDVCVMCDECWNELVKLIEKNKGC